MLLFYELDKLLHGLFSERNGRDDQFEPSEKLNAKVCLYQGDITALEIDAIVNAGKIIK